MKILVGYDESRVAETVLDLAHKHAKVFKADICIMTSMKQGPELTKEVIDRAESKLEKIKMSFKADDILCESKASVCFQSPGEDLVEYAKNNDVDEIKSWKIGVRFHRPICHPGSALSSDCC